MRRGTFFARLPVKWFSATQCFVVSLPTRSITRLEKQSRLQMKLANKIKILYQLKRKWFRPVKSITWNDLIILETHDKMRGFIEKLVSAARKLQNNWPKQCKLATVQFCLKDTMVKTDWRKEKKNNVGKSRQQASMISSDKNFKVRLDCARASTFCATSRY